MVNNNSGLCSLIDSKMAAHLSDAELSEFSDSDDDSDADDDCSTQMMADFMLRCFTKVQGAADPCLPEPLHVASFGAAVQHGSTLSQRATKDAKRVLAEKIVDVHEGRPKRVRTARLCWQRKNIDRDMSEIHELAWISLC